MSLARYATRLSSASVSSVGDALLRFVRTMVLSRMLSPHDLGGAVALMAILTACEVVTDIGLDKFVMVTRVDARAQVVAVARQMAVGRAVLLGAAILLLAPLLATAFGAGEERHLVAWLALVPVLASFRNWRVIQLQLDYRYAPDAATTLGGRVAGLVILWPAHLLVHDARLMLASLVAEAAVMVVLSYVLAPTERVSAIDPAIRREAMRFGLPLMANGIGLIALKQLDQVIVSNLFGLASLAQYSLALNLAIIPTSIAQQVGGKIALPFLTRAGTDAERAAPAALLAVLATLIAAAALAVPIGLTLDRLIPVVYGPHYRVGTGFAALAMLAAFMRFSRGAPNMILLQHGRTGRLMVGNMITGVGLLIGLLLALKFRTRESVLAGVVIGDLLSFALFSYLLRRYLAVGEMWRHGAVLAAAVGLAAVALWLGGGSWTARGLAMAGSLLVIGADALVIRRRLLLPFLSPGGPAAASARRATGAAMPESAARRAELRV